MTIKEFLRDIRKSEILIQHKKEELDKARSLAVYNGVKMGDMPSGTGDPSKSRTNALVKIMDYEDELNDAISELVERKRQGTMMVDSLDDPIMIDIFYRRYFEYQTWEEIAEKVGYTLQWIHELHRRGLIELSGKFKIY